MQLTPLKPVNLSHPKIKQENDLIGFLDNYDPKKFLPNTFCSPKVWQSFELHPNKSWSMRNEN